MGFNSFSSLLLTMKARPGVGLDWRGNLKGKGAFQSYSEPMGTVSSPGMYSGQRGFRKYVSHKQLGYIRVGS